MNHYQEEYIPESKRLGVIDGIEITDVRYKRSAFLVDGFLKPGLSVLAGAPKIGKSWMVLQLCLSVAKGEPFMGMNTRKSTVLYIDLEDSEQRMQDRILRSAEESSISSRSPLRAVSWARGSPTRYGTSRRITPKHGWW